MFDAAEAQLIGLFLESLLFGALSVFSLISVWILSRREPNRTGLSFLNKWMIGISLAMLLLAATHVGLTVQRVLKGFSYESRDEVDDFFHTDATPPYVVQTILLTILTMIGDGFMAYRVSVLWNRSPFPVGLSFLLVCGTTFSGLRTAYELAKSPGSPSTLAPTALVQTSAFIGLSLVTNLVSTLLLLWRVYGLGRGINKTGSGVFASTVHWRVMRTIVQSEALYSAALIANLAVYLSASPMLEILLDVLPQLVGISFTLIILHVGLSGASDDVQMKDTTAPSALSFGRGEGVASLPGHASTVLVLPSIRDSDDQLDVETGFTPEDNKLTSTMI